MFRSTLTILWLTNTHTYSAVMLSIEDHDQTLIQQSLGTTPETHQQPLDSTATMTSTPVIPITDVELEDYVYVLAYQCSSIRAS